MTRFALLALALLATACRSDAPRGGDLHEDKVAMVKDGDAEMTAAITRARARLPEFWRELEASSAGEVFSVKVPVRDAAGTEFFWLADLTRANGRVSGRLDNRPNIVTTVKEGQRLEVAESEVVDWLYLRGGKMYGNFTVRPLLPQLPPDQAAQIRAMLAEP